MRKFAVIILMLFSFSIPSFAVSVKEVKAFDSLKGSSSIEPFFDFLRKYPDSPFKKAVVEILISKLYEKKRYDAIVNLHPDRIDIDVDDFFLLKYADALKFTGSIEKAKKVYLSIFSRSNRYDEEVIVKNAGDTAFLFENSTIVRKKVWYALRNRNFEIAAFYLDKLPLNDKYYTYLKGVLHYKKGNRKKARFFFEASDVPESKFYLLLLEKNPFKKVELLRELLLSDAKDSFKRLGARIVLNNLITSNLPLCRKAINVVKNYDLEIYREFLARYYINTGDFNSAIAVLKKMDTPYSYGLLFVLNKYLKKNMKIKVSFVPDFYQFATGDLKKIKFKEPSVLMINDEGLRFIIESKKFYLLDFIDGSKVDSYDLAIALYLGKRYRRAIKFAAVSDRDKPEIRRVLYPTPEIFGGDIISLSIARQESLFEPGAFSRSGAIGYMQIMPSTGKHIASLLNDDFDVANLYDEKVNVNYGTFYIKRLIRRFGSFPIAAAAYNAGPGRVNRWLKIYGKPKNGEELVLFVDTFIPFDETRNYVKKVIVNCFYYSAILGSSSSICRIQ
ncbi:lytic transglycosylase domain-containing protein [Desulfurobacterium atlanticum]|uniref:Soluble lytic murein transglycosylase n=1 Tax=Desulfurobacterium atlanticum TaxID=240169 RepID=A0A238YE48_9BACT|nr:lytic transglycosylase domain-containing protein [Desulfurobacterium atlanticum]SNR69330.1 soluble lytic murein transglycosylase [Desulfurobacterium atlanticum]